MKTDAVIMTGPKKLSVESLIVNEPVGDEVIIEIHYSGISSGTEKLFWTGLMPHFPGMGYPLVPGYESVGEVVSAAPNTGFKSGDFVFVPGANCFGEIKGLFGGAAKMLVTSASRVIKIDRKMGSDGALFALAATARHALAGFGNELPDLIVGHGVLGRLLARLTVAAGGDAPTVWEINEDRMAGAQGYEVIVPESDKRKDYNAVYDVSGDPSIINKLVGRISKGGEIVLAGFYPGDINFAFPAAFMKEARFRVSAEFNPEDVNVTRTLIEAGDLSLEGLVTHKQPAKNVSEAYENAFNDPKCLKMILDWREAA
jgi:3-hydroxyethyl bacteriochlorophyllide a dehydrogenase